MAMGSDPAMISGMRRLFLALLSSTAASAVLATEVSVRIPSFGALRAGETARIEWQGIPSEVEELELLLTVEGRELPVRVTPQLCARAGVLVWRVPNLPSGRARLTVRFGLEGEEIESAPSVSFEILPADGEPPAVLAFREGEWWADQSDAGRFPGNLGPSEEGDRLQETRECPSCAGSSYSVSARGTGRVRGARRQMLRREVSRSRPTLPREPIEAPARI